MVEQSSSKQQGNILIWVITRHLQGLEGCKFLIPMVTVRSHSKVRFVSPQLDYDQFGGRIRQYLEGPATEFLDGFHFCKGSEVQGERLAIAMASMKQLASGLQRIFDNIHACEKIWGAALLVPTPISLTPKFRCLKVAQQIKNVEHSILIQILNNNFSYGQCWCESHMKTVIAGYFRRFREEGQMKLMYLFVF